MSNFGLSCDVCGKEVQGYTWVNGMKFCAKCYQETFGNKNMTENLNNMYEVYLKILNEKDQRIAELEEQLKNAIVPKFKIAQQVFYVVDKYSPVLSGEVLEIQIWDLKKDNIIYVIEYSGNVHCESVVFETLEEAQAKLEELKGEKE